MISSFQNIFNQKVKYIFLHQQDSFDDNESLSQNRSVPLHIYLIGKTPKIKIDNTKTVITDADISMTFYTSVMGEKKEIPIKTINPSGRPICKICSEYPYNFVTAYDENGDQVSIAKCSLLLKSLSAQQGLYFDEFDLEVLYIGQAFGQDGSRISVDRLKSHEKAQKIYFETQQKFPDFEVWFVALVFEPLLMTLFTPSEAGTSSDFAADLTEQQKLEQTGITPEQQITIAEAALIKYFNTYEYNKEYLNFPSPQHKSYEELYELDYNSAGFELTSYSIYTKLWSKSVVASFQHFQIYYLHSDEDRRSVFLWEKL